MFASSIRVSIGGTSILNGMDRCSLEGLTPLQSTLAVNPCGQRSATGLRQEQSILHR